MLLAWPSVGVRAEGGKGDLLVAAKGDLLLPSPKSDLLAPFPNVPMQPDLSTAPGMFVHFEPASYFDDGVHYDFDRFAQHVSSIPIDMVAVFGATVALGFLDWDWGSSSFHVGSEGFFGTDTKNGGMDKLGHAWSAALISDYFTARIRESAADPRGAAITGAVLSMGVMVGIEFFDGFAATHGFSPEDILFDALGVGFSFLRNTVPGMREKLDFRMEYVPSGNHDAFAPQSDYSGQKYLLALKLAGFEELSDTPLRFLELQVGYYARGFTREEKLDGESKQRQVYVAIGINLQELLFGRRIEGEPRLKSYARSFFEYVEVPYTYATFAPGAYDY
jgi:hypothetical protein